MSPLEASLLGAIPTIGGGLFVWMAKSKVAEIMDAIRALVSEVKEMRKDLAVLAVHEARIERLEMEMGKHEDRIRELEGDLARLSVRSA